MEETKELTVNEKLDKLLNAKELEEEKGEDVNKPWRIPILTRFKSNVGKKRIEKGWATIILIRSNRNLAFLRAQVKDGMAIIDGFPRICTSDHTLFFKRKPFYIIPEWSLKPFSPEDNYAQTERDKMNIAGRRAVLATLETEKIKTKKDLGGIIWIVLGVIVCGGAYYFGKQAGWF
jgi:hypothetical protein